MSNTKHIPKVITIFSQEAYATNEPISIDFFIDGERGFVQIPQDYLYEIIFKHLEESQNHSVFHKQPPIPALSEEAIVELENLIQKKNRWNAAYDELKKNF